MLDGADENCSMARRRMISASFIGSLEAYFPRNRAVFIAIIAVSKDDNPQVREKPSARRVA
jgi:hypothetical protein